MTGLRDNLRTGMDIGKYIPLDPPKLIKRQFEFGASASSRVLLVPANAHFVIARAMGPGGSAGVPNNAAGGGGAFVRLCMAVKPGQTLDASVSIGGGTDTTITQTRPDNTIRVLLRAKAGGPSLTSGVAGPGGFAGQCVGTFCRSGGNGSGTSGGNPGSDTVDNDCLNLMGIGAESSPPGKYGVGYGFGGSRYQGATRPGGPGILVLEYYTRDPRNIIV